MRKGQRVFIIDLFAGPGGLGEGFSSYNTLEGLSPFKIVLSVEKEQVAHSTLHLRSFFRQFSGEKPREYYEYIRGEIDKETLFNLYPKEASNASKEAWCAELGMDPHDEVKRRIKDALDGSKNWVLIGGPPCQAYSLVGRSRMKGLNPKIFEEDKRHFLYKEYLRIIADHKPPVFVMENVKGLLSSKVNGNNIFDKILEDLNNPLKSLGKTNGLKYKIYSLVKDVENESFDPRKDYVIESEKYGIPQSRHRLILLGIREDISVKPALLEERSEEINLEDVISDLPKLRSGISKGEDSSECWKNAVGRIKRYKWFCDKKQDREFKCFLTNKLKGISESQMIGSEFLKHNRYPKCCKDWYWDKGLRGVCNHTARKHLEQDLHRYFYASCFAEWYKKSPRISDFPKEIWPKHKNIIKASQGKMFADRFRVQLKGRPATTITSHISKDGHYFIHPDPIQCRSLTVREAARVQTFPDNYFFEGPRTLQYQQVGNAVPPLLARQIANIVYNIFD